MQRLKATFRAAAIWAMIPLTLLSGTPLMACLCANGDLKLLCRGRIDFSRAPAEACDSCAKEQPQVEEALPVCCRGEVVVAEDGNQLAVTSRCCQGVLRLPTPSVTAEKASVPDQNTISLPLFVSSLISDTISASHQGETLSREALPPPDLVIWHHAFLI